MQHISDPDRNAHDPASSPAAALCEQDVRMIVRLLGQVADMSGTPLDRKQALMDGLCRWLDIDAWIWVVSRFDGDKPPMAVLFHHAGLTERQIGLVLEASSDLEVPLPETPGTVADIRRGVACARLRRDWVPDDRAWYGRSFELYRRAIGLDDFVYGLFPIAGNLFSGIGLHRRIGRTAFTERDRLIVQIIVSEIPWLHRAGLPEAEAASLGTYGRSVSDLTPRLRVVFGLLIQGWKRDQIAAHMGISQNTVKTHIREVYRHFGVADHVGLLNRFMGNVS